METEKSTNNPDGRPQKHGAVKAALLDRVEQKADSTVQSGHGGARPNSGPKKPKRIDVVTALEELNFNVTYEIVDLYMDAKKKKDLKMRRECLEMLLEYGASKPRSTPDEDTGQSTNEVVAGLLSMITQMAGTNRPTPKGSDPD